MIQTTLFGEPHKTKVATSKRSLGKIKWSHSKRGLMDTCLRKYFYTYYGTKNNNPESQEIISLKRLSTKEIVYGNIIHWIIASSLRNAQKGTEWDYDRIISFDRKMLNDSIALSKRFNKIKESTGQENIFMEIVFSENNSDDILDDGLERIETCIDNLFESGEFFNIYEAGKLEDSLIERNTIFRLTESVTMYGQLDVGYHEGAGIRIVDWKSGEKSFEDSSLQLSAYALWASRIEKIEPEHIRLSKAYLYEDFGLDIFI